MNNWMGAVFQANHCLEGFITFFPSLLILLCSPVPLWRVNKQLCGCLIACRGQHTTLAFLGKDNKLNCENTKTTIIALLIQKHKKLPEVLSKLLKYASFPQQQKYHITNRLLDNSEFPTISHTMSSIWFSLWSYKKLVYKSEHFQRQASILVKSDKQITNLCIAGSSFSVELQCSCSAVTIVQLLILAAKVILVNVWPMQLIHIWSP